MSEPVVAVDRLRVSFGVAEPVVNDLSLELVPGRILALVGESGSGKTVSAMSIPGLLPPSARVEGSIRFRGQALPVGKQGADALRSIRGTGIGVVFQEPMASFTPVLSIGTQIAEALRAHDRHTADVTARVERDLASVGIDDPRHVRTSYPHELSGGQLQRAMIALALAQEPAVLIADEPTTALDVTVQAGVLDLIRSLARDRQLAVLLITHDMGVVADVADDVLVMRRGVEVERGSVREVFASPRAGYTRELLAAVPDLERPSSPGTPSGSGDSGNDSASGDSPASASATPGDIDSCDMTAWDASKRSYGTNREGGGDGREVVRMRDVAIRYARRAEPAVSGIDLEVRAGRTLGLVGESGSGKSTIGRVLAGIVPAASGSVEVDGIDLRTAHGRRMRELRSRVGIVFQDPASSLNPRKSIGWSIAEPLLVQSRDSRSSADRAAREQRVAELLTSVRLDPEYASRYPHELSGGQRQRVGIARALALRPALVIADEPTSALDVTVQAAVLDLLRELQSDIGFACLLISHDLAVVRQMADEVVVLHRGRIVERGSVADVLDRPRDAYTRMLLAAAPVADPVRQAERRDAWRAFAELERAEESA